MQSGCFLGLSAAFSYYMLIDQDFANNSHLGSWATSVKLRGKPQQQQQELSNGFLGIKLTALLYTRSIPSLGHLIMTFSNCKLQQPLLLTPLWVCLSQLSYG